MIFLLIGYMWLFIHRPFEVWGWLGDLRIERVYMLAMLVYWLLPAHKSWTHNRVNWGVGLLGAVIIIATLLSSYSSFSSENIQNWFKILIFYILLMSSVNEESDFKLLIISFVVIMGLFELHSLYEYSCGRGEYRMGVWRMVGVGTSLSDPNSFAASVNYGLPLLLPVWILARNIWHRLLVIGLFVMACICIILTGSRTGMVALALLLGGASIFSPYRWRILPLFCIAGIVFWANLPQELQHRYLTLINPSLGPANALESADSRQLFFSMAAKIWSENPIFGVGPYGFSKASGTGMQSHSLYAELLSEVGLAGVLAFIVLVWTILQNYLEGKKIYKNYQNLDSKFCFLVLIATMVGIFQLLFMGFGGHNLYRFTWIWYAAFSALSVKMLFIQMRPSILEQ